MIPRAQSPPRRQIVVVAVAMAALAVAATWPVASNPAHLSVVRPTDNDFRLNNYFIFWGAHALLTDPLSLHHTNMFHPERYTFVYADILLAQSLVMLPVIEAFYNPVLTFNLLLICGLVIGGVGFFLLARVATGHSGAAFVGALLWVFNPVHFTRYQQIQLIGDHWLPWMAWALWTWLGASDDRARVGRLRWAVAAALFFCLNALSGSHLAVFGALAAALIFGYFGLRDSRWRQAEFRRGAAAFALVALLLLGPIFWPYLLVEERLAASRAETLDLPAASLRPLEALSARSNFYRWLEETAGWPGVLNREGRELRAYGFPGVVTLALAVTAIFAGPRRTRAQRRFWALMAAFFVFLAMGSYGGYLLVGELPLFRLIRVPTRFLLPAVFALAMLAAHGVAACAERLRGTRGQAAALAAIAALFAIEASFAPLRTWPYAHEPRALNTFLAEQPGDFAVVEFPLDPFGYAINMRQVANSVYHWKRLLVGYSGFQTPENVALLRQIRDTFPADACLDELTALDVRFVVLLADRVDPMLLVEVAAQPRLQKVWEHDTWRVYRIEGADSAAG
jgi:hypothetical protein